MVKNSIKESVRAYLNALKTEGIPVHFGMIFGSQTTGMTHQWSDIDLVVVSPCFDGSPRLEDVDRLWEVTTYTDHRIEPIPCGVLQWEHDDFTPIIEIARREGEKITLLDQE